MTLPEKMIDWMKRLRVMELISSPVTAAKVGASGVIQTIAPRAEEVAGSFWRLWLPQIAEQAGIEGQGLRPGMEARIARTEITKGLKDAADIFLRGRSELDENFGGADTWAPPTWVDYIANFHGAEKAVAVRGSFKRTRDNLLRQARDRGQDFTSPAAIERAEQTAYEHSFRAKFLQDNAVVSAWQKAIGGLKRNEYGPIRALGHALDLLLPIVKTPTNIAGSAIQHIAGVPLGLAEAARVHWYDGIKNIKPEQADRIFRMLKKGTLGMPLLALGIALGPEVVGGFYSGRRREDEPAAGEIKIGNITVPAWVTAHSPPMMALHFAGALTRAAGQVKRGEIEPGGAIAGIGSAVSQLLEEVPFVREQTEIAHLGEGQALGRLARSFAVPAAIQWAAQRTDIEQGTGNFVTGTPQRRHPESFGQTLAVGVPGLRQLVPEGQARAIESYHTEYHQLRTAREGFVRRGLRYPEERRYQQLRAIHPAMIELEHAATGLTPTPNGLVQVKPPPPDRVQQLRQRQLEIVRRINDLR